MPKAQEEALKKVGRAKGYKGKRLDKFVYGTMVKRYGWRPSREK